MMAVWRRGKADALRHHSDQGTQYTSEQFQRLLQDHGITCSMSRAGNVWDRAMGPPRVRVSMARSAMESFFSSLKTERTARKVYRTRDAVRADVFDYVERFCNSQRRHPKLGYLSPVAFETHTMQTQPGVHETGSRPRSRMWRRVLFRISSEPSTGGAIGLWGEEHLSHRHRQFRTRYRADAMASGQVGMGCG